MQRFFSDFTALPQAGLPLKFGDPRSFLWLRGAKWDVRGGRSAGKKSGITLAKLGAMTLWPADESETENYHPLSPPERAFEIARDFERCVSEGDMPFRPRDGRFSGAAVGTVLNLTRIYGPLTVIADGELPHGWPSVADTVVEALEIAAAFTALTALSQQGTPEWAEAFSAARESLVVASNARADLTGADVHREIATNIEGRLRLGGSDIQHHLLTTNIADLITMKMDAGSVKLGVLPVNVDWVAGFAQCWRPANLRGAIWTGIASVAIERSELVRCKWGDCRRLFVKPSAKSLALYCPANPDLGDRGCQAKAKEQRRNPRSPGTKRGEQP